MRPPATNCELTTDASHDIGPDILPLDVQDDKQDAVDSAAELFEMSPTTAHRSGVDIENLGQETVYLLGGIVMAEGNTLNCLGPDESREYFWQAVDSVEFLYIYFQSGGMEEPIADTWKRSCSAFENVTGHGYDGVSPGGSALEDSSAYGFDLPSTGARQTAAVDVAAEPSSTTSDGGSAVPDDGVVPDWNILLGVAVLAALAGGLLPLLRRIRGEELLDHDLRCQLLEIVREHPAANTSEVADALDVDVTTVLYHARRMEDADLLVVKRYNGEVVFFDPKQHPKEIRNVAATLRHDTKRRLLSLLAREPGLNLSEIARRLDRAPSTVKRHADALIETGLVRSDDDGAARRLDVTDGVRETLNDLDGDLKA